MMTKFQVWNLLFQCILLALKVSKNNIIKQNNITSHFISFCFAFFLILAFHISPNTLNVDTKKKYREGRTFIFLFFFFLFIFLLFILYLYNKLKFENHSLNKLKLSLNKTLRKKIKQLNSNRKIESKRTKITIQFFYTAKTNIL